MSEKRFNKTFQRVQICGRLAKDPIIKEFQSGKSVCNFGLIVNDDNGGTDYIPCVAWEHKAKLISENLTQGALILCEGKIKSSSYKDSEHRKQFQIQFELSRTGLLLFLDNKRPDLDELKEFPALGDES